MTVSSEIKDQFVKYFQNRVHQGRQLLQNANHQWASRLFTDLHFQIEKTEWLVSQKKRQLIMIIANSWWIYLNSLKKDQIDIVKYIDAYKRFFSFLSQLDEFDLFNNFWNNLLKDFMKIEDLSIDGITKFINSFSIKVKEREDYLRLVELQILLMALRKSVFPSELFSFSLKFIGEILYKLEPSKKALLLFVFIENINLKYKLVDTDVESQEFILNINKILSNRLPPYLKEDFSNMRKISVNENNFENILADLEELIYYLNDITEFKWIIIVLRYIYSKLKEFQSFEVAISYIKNFIDFAIKRNRFVIAYEIYDFLDDVLLMHSDLGYEESLIELWVDACKKFFELKERKYLLLSMEKLNNHLKIPQTPEQIFHYFYTFNHLWKFKTKFFTLDPLDFWKMMFYRALYLEKDFDLTQKIIPYIEDEIRSKLTDLNSLYNEAESVKSQIYSFKEDSDELLASHPEFVLNKGIVRINSEGLISFRLISPDFAVVEGDILNEYWNDTIIIDIYNDLFSGKKEKSYKFNLTEFGKLLYLFLPKSLRDVLKQLKDKKPPFISHIYFILDMMTIPFGLVHDGDNFFMLKYGSSYKIGEPPLAGISFEQIIQEESTTTPPKKLINVLLIEAINSKGPLKWNEEFKNKTLIFPFPDGYDEVNHITNFLNVTSGVQIKLLTGPNSTREKILTELSSGACNVIHFVGNIFYSKMSPHDSYFLTNDKKAITIQEVKNLLEATQSPIQPFIFFNSQFFDVDGRRLKNVLKQFGEIFSQFNFNRITGIISRTYPIFNEDARKIIENLYVDLFVNNYNQGGAMLKARRQCKSGLAISSFVMFGNPWKKLFA